MSGRKIVVLGTGGTIAGRAPSATDNVTYKPADMGVGELVASLSPPAGCTLGAEQVAQIDSKDMDHAVWLQLARRCAHWLADAQVQGIVVTHGTDTLEETAFFLQAVLAPRKPVVLVGAMRPATSIGADGPQNLADALSVAAWPGARGVMVMFAGSVHGADSVAKWHTYRADAFWSGDAGPIAHVEEGQLRQLRDWPDGSVLRPVDALPEAAQWPRVEIVLNHAGADGTVVRALATAGVRGIVVAGTGNGSVSGKLAQALLEAQAAGIAVRRATRLPQGPLLDRRYGLAPGASPSAVKSRIALMLELMG